VNPDDVGGHRMMRVGKHEAGALLDGVEWKQFPNVGLLASADTESEEVADVLD
jgi:hypothetical protein